MAWWHNQMETFFMLLALCEGNPPVNGGFPSQRPGHRALKFSLICAWTNGWANNRDTGDLRCHLAHYYITVMSFWNVPRAPWVNHNMMMYVSTYSLHHASPYWVINNQELHIVNLSTQLSPHINGVINFIVIFAVYFMSYYSGNISELCWNISDMVTSASRTITMVVGYLALIQYKDVVLPIC